MGPVSPPYTGQSVAFTTIVDSYKKRNDYKTIIVDLSNKNGISSGIFLIIRISILILIYNIDVIYFTCSRSFLGSIRDVVLLFWARLLKIRTINHLHGGDFLMFYNSSQILYKKILKWCYEKIDTSIVLINGMETLFSNFTKMKIKIVSNSYDSSLDNFPEVKNQNNAVVKLLYLSNIMESKGILNLLDAFGDILKLNDKCCLVIAGDFVSDYISSKDFIKTKFLEKYNKLKQKYPNNIEYRGVVKGIEKYDLLWDSDIFILPTYHRTEAFPISLLEALRAGNYIIATRHNYIPQIITEKNGLLVQPNSIESLRIAFQNIFEQERSVILDIQNRNIRYAISSFKEEVYVNNITEIIDENLNNNSNI